MKIYCLGAGKNIGPAPESITADPRFRRASPLSLCAISAMEALLEKIPLLPGDQTGVILATNHGELNVTLQFLENWAKRNVSRPLLFQSSLHHSTLGLLSILYNLTGPTFTVSQKESSAESALQLAQTLLQSKRCEECLVLEIDEEVRLSPLEAQTTIVSMFARTLLLGTHPRGPQSFNLNVEAKLQAPRSLAEWVP